MRINNVEIKWLNHHAAILLSDAVKVYIDPWELREARHDADIVLITHAHYDHNSPEDVEKAQNEKTLIIGPPDCIAAMKGMKKAIKPRDTITEKGVKIEAVPAHNVNKPFHPKGNNWVGYIVEIDGVRVYHAGDTDRIEEMKNIKCDVALLPAGGTYTMNGKEAGEAANDILPKIAVPIHWGRVGSKKEVEDMKKVTKVKVQVLDYP